MYQVYLCGRITGLSYQRANGWRIQAEEALKCFGFMALNPLRGVKSVNGYPVTPELDTGNTLATALEGTSIQDIFDRDTQDVLSCDVVLAKVDAGTFNGSSFELGVAWATGKPIVLFGDTQALKHIFFHCCATYIASDMDDAIRWIHTEFVLNKTIEAAVAQERCNPYRVYIVECSKGGL